MSKLESVDAAKTDLDESPALRMINTFSARKNMDMSNFESINSVKYAKQRETGNLLRIHNLTKTYDGKVKVVDDLNV